MHRLVADLPALFRRGVVPEGFAPALDTGDLPRPGQQLTEVCAEGIQSLELLLSHLETGKRIHAATSRPPGLVASASRSESLWQGFLQAVPDRDLELSSVWAHAATHLQGSEMDPEQRETQLKDLALLALWRRSCLVRRFLVDRLSNCACSDADLAILRPSMKAEIQMFKALLTTISAGSVGACAVAATAQATRDAAQQRRSAAAAAATALVQRRCPVPAAPVPVPGRAPVEPPNSTVEGIQRWLHSVRETASVAASGSDTDWKRQKEVLRAGLTGTAVCLGSDSWPSPKGSLRITSERECAICLEMLPAGAMPEKVIPLPCGHSFHSTCASQWLQKCPRCPVCRHSPFLPLEVKKAPLP